MNYGVVAVEKLLHFVSLHSSAKQHFWSNYISLKHNGSPIGQSNKLVYHIDNPISGKPT